MKSWKTTACGCFGAVVNVLVPLLKTGTVDVQTLIVSAFLAVAGVLAKDYDATGAPK